MPILDTAAKVLVTTGALWLKGLDTLVKLPVKGVAWAEQFLARQRTPEQRADARETARVRVAVGLPACPPGMLEVRVKMASQDEAMLMRMDPGTMAKYGLVPNQEIDEGMLKKIMRAELGLDGVLPTP